jgi:PAS domain S-box-containing protein
MGDPKVPAAGGFPAVPRSSGQEQSSPERNNVIATNLFGLSVGGTTSAESFDFIAGVLQSSTEHSIIAGSPDGQILLWNEGARRLYGYEPEEVVGRMNWGILFTPEDTRAGKPAEILELAQRDGRWQGLVPRVAKGGRRFVARVVVTPHRDGRGRFFGFLLISKDISNEIQVAQSEE